MEPSSPKRYSMRPTLRAAVLSFLVHNNPFYLLSALCMIAGCYALNGALDLRSGEVARVLLLIGVINLYEVLLIALGVYLIRARGLVRDGRTLLLLQCVFLVDLTFLNAELTTGGLRVGVGISAVVLVLALAKVAFVLRMLSARFPARLFAFVAVQLLALFAIPCLFKWLGGRDGYLTARQFYAVWWVVGLLPAMAEVQRRLAEWFGESPGLDPHGGMRPRIGRVYAVTAYASLLAHMGLMHWVYQVPFHLADASPVLLGLTFAASGAAPSAALRPGDVRLIRWLLPAAAVALSIGSPLDLFPAGRGGRFDVSPLHLTAAGAYLAYVYVYFLHHAALLLGAAAAAGGVVLLGPTVQQVLDTIAATWRWSLDLAYRLLPKTAGQWGVTAVVGAFAFLGIGAALSLSQGKLPKPATAAPPPSPPPPPGDGDERSAYI